MFKLVPLIGFGFATVSVGYVAMQYSRVATAITQTPAGRESMRLPRTRPEESARSALIRCLTDVDDLLDTVRDPASFALVRPMILDRMRKHSARVWSLSDQRATKLSPTETKAMEKATNRHLAAVVRANQVAPGVVAFFEKDVGAIVSGK